MQKMEMHEWLYVVHSYWQKYVYSEFDKKKKMSLTEP